ncbi:hypothetical protein [Tsukamurella tyrosinosolvens]|uniref:hypothetical protein n=1 Tax=Tsukamurella tyrosinosolvens TaxID=57704 RepID=UPI002DD41F16|nr:hypothetical protein [Tsukamurella tyrosinosolvens]MEC4614616.1 hypothetical protein [Tsukamurella tyrosinosolvens]
MAVDVTDPAEEFGESGAALYVALESAYLVDEVNMALVVNACRIADNMSRLTESLRDAPLIVTNHKGDQVVNPLVGEHARLATSLRGIFTSLGVSKMEGYVRSMKPRTPAGAVIDRARAKLDIQRRIVELQSELEERESMDAFLASGGLDNDKDNE